jgi:hypothetical protein
MSRTIETSILEMIDMDAPDYPKNGNKYIID